MIIRVAARGSRLSRAQVREVEEYIRSSVPSVRLQHIEVTTLGDRVRDRPVHLIGRIGVFEKEVNKAVLDGRADVAVHSLKDLPSALPPGLEIVVVPPRRDPRDSIVPRPPKAGLAPGSRVGTSSVRRAGLARLHYPGVKVEPLRGNLDTRLRKLEEGMYDYIIVAEAGLQRLGSKVPRLKLDPLVWPPAPGQGLLAVVAPEDSRVAGLLRRIDHRESRAMAEAERGILYSAGSGCRAPLGGYSRVHGQMITVWASTIIDGRLHVARARGPIERARAVGEEAGYMISKMLEGDEV
ncbi:MAG: hydroxymethylbilane synthase [Desulfurococcales archaeon]|nr:hydroxymethylbilane synthase [Desulfurococcales archaeon]